VTVCDRHKCHKLVIHSVWLVQTCFCFYLEIRLGTAFSLHHGRPFLTHRRFSWLHAEKKKNLSQNESTDRYMRAMISYWLQHTQITTPFQKKKTQIGLSTAISGTHRYPRVKLLQGLSVTNPIFFHDIPKTITDTVHQLTVYRYGLSIDCIVPKGRREPGSQTRGAGCSKSPSVRRRTEVRRPSFPRCCPTWISRPRHLRGLPPWPTTSLKVRGGMAALPGGWSNSKLVR